MATCLPALAVLLNAAILTWLVQVYGPGGTGKLATGGKPRQALSGSSGLDTDVGQQEQLPQQVFPPSLSTLGRPCVAHEQLLLSQANPYFICSFSPHPCWHGSSVSFLQTHNEQSLPDVCTRICSQCCTSQSLIVHPWKEPAWASEQMPLLVGRRHCI